MLIIKLVVKIVRLFTVIIFLLGSVFFIFSNYAHAQAGQIWETIVGNPGTEPPDDSGGDGGGGDGASDKNLPTGIFKPPFSCNIIYKGSTYPGPNHIWEVDFNRSTGEDRGDPVFASAAGHVSLVLIGDGAVVIKHYNNTYGTVYAHMRNIRVRTNDKVKLGQKIGEISDVGRASGPHLHYEQFKNVWSDAGKIRVAFDGKPHPASLPGNTLIKPPGIGPVNCRVLY